MIEPRGIELVPYGSTICAQGCQNSPPGGDPHGNRDRNENPLKVDLGTGAGITFSTMWGPP